MINSPLVNLALILSALASFIIVIFPEIDIIFSAFFFNFSEGFIYRENIVVYQIYRIIPLLTKVFVFFCFIYILVIGFRYRDYRYILKTGVFFLLLSAIIGPGIVVNSILKETFGRARPSQIITFNGSKEFTPAFKIAKQCDTNCSFSSGHAAMGFYFTAIAYVVSATYFNRIYLAGLIFGSCVGLSRIVMGGHFLSDVLVSALIVLLLNHLIFILWQRLIGNLKT